ncbi:MAG: RNA 2',3'-cyclic phosphodiesterase [Pseudomonadota bacterium]
MSLPLFIGIDLPSGVSERLAGLGGGVPGARWVPAENMHVTLRYIGDVDGTMADDIATGLAQIGGTPFEIAVEGVDRFGGKNDTRVIYAGVVPREPLKHLRDKIETMLQRLGMQADERRYTPHVTLARLKRAPQDRVGRFLEHHGMLMTERFEVRQFHLYASMRGHDGAVYRIEHSYPLG